MGIKGLLAPLLLLLKEALKLATLAECGVSMIAPLKPSLISFGACATGGGLENVFSRLVGRMDDTLGLGVEKFLPVACGAGLSCDGDASEGSSILFFRNPDGLSIVDCTGTSAEMFLDATLLNVTPVGRAEDMFVGGADPPSPKSMALA